MAELLSTIETTIAAALERLAAEHQRSADGADAKDVHRFFASWSGAFRKALLYYLQGTRPQQTPGGAWLITSATRAGRVHQVGANGHCSCEAGAKQQACWHCAIVCGVEVGMDDLDRFDDADEPEPEQVA